MNRPNRTYPVGQNQPQFIEHQHLDWSRVRKTHSLIHQRFHYDYPAHVRELRHRLVVVPADQHGAQQLRAYQLQVSAPAADQRVEADDFGNRIFQFHIAEVEAALDFEIWSLVEQDMQDGVRPLVPADQTNYYLTPTPLTTPDSILLATAHELMQQHPEPWTRAQHINAWTYQAMRYGRGVTTVHTTAAEALALGCGLCQDYAHIMLALCRAAQLPARYVSGHLLGEGASHAWVEVLLPSPKQDILEAWALDPTNQCAAHHKYITIAIGRDYADVTPTSGSFLSSQPGRLTVSKRAGLTAVEYTDGQVVNAESSP